MKYRLTEDWLEYKKGHVFEESLGRVQHDSGFIIANGVETSLLLKTGILEEVKGPSICTRENGCGLAFIQGRECYDGEPCEDVRVKSQNKEMKEEEWPTKWNGYWWVDGYGEIMRDTWENRPHDKDLQKYGNVFRSETAAKEASEKIKTLLLSLKK